MEDISNLLGEDPTKSKDPAFLLHAALVPRSSHTITHDLSKEAKEATLAKYNVPGNCKYLIPPQVNPEVKSIMSTAHLSRDSTHLRYQTLVDLGLSPLGVCHH